MYLFVYGSLRKTPSRRAVSQHLVDANRQLLLNATFYGEACVRGHLYSLGEYPGIVLDEQCDQFVKGEIYKIDPEILNQLDEFEEIGQKAEESNQKTEETEYRRIEVGVLTHGQYLSAWIYELNNQKKIVEKIESGDWCD